MGSCRKLAFLRLYLQWQLREARVGGRCPFATSCRKQSAFLDVVVFMVFGLAVLDDFLLGSLVMTGGGGSKMLLGRMMVGGGGSKVADKVGEVAS